MTLCPHCGLPTSMPSKIDGPFEVWQGSYWKATYGDPVEAYRYAHQINQANRLKNAPLAVVKSEKDRG